MGWIFLAATVSFLIGWSAGRQYESHIYSRPQGSANDLNSPR
jgi:hypothetical protein